MCISLSIYTYIYIYTCIYIYIYESYTQIIVPNPRKAGLVRIVPMCVSLYCAHPLINPPLLNKNPFDPSEAHRPGAALALEGMLQHMCIYVYVYMYIYIYIYTHTCMYMCIYMYT